MAEDIAPAARAKMEARMERAISMDGGSAPDRSTASAKPGPPKGSW